MAAEAHAPTPSEYIVHHLTHFNGTGGAQKNIIDFSVVNWDTVLFSVLMAVATGWLLYKAARQVTSGVPGRFSGAIESLVEFVDEQARSVIHGERRMIAPLGLVVFVWVVLM